MYFSGADHRPDGIPQKWIESTGYQKPSEFAIL